MIQLVSFVEAGQLDPRLWARWSAARWAPGFARGWPVAKWAVPLRSDGSAIKLRDFGEDPLPKYHEFMLELYRARWPQIRDWLYRYGGTHNALACWCPYTKTAKRQLQSFGTFHCHLGVVAEVLESTGTPWMFGPQHSEDMVGKEIASW